MTASASGWGQGVDPMDLLRGDLVCKNDFGANCGLALPGNGYGGTSSGWQNVTLILPQAAAVNRFAVGVYDYLKAPTHYRLLACEKSECKNNGDWALVTEDKNNQACTTSSAPSPCSIQISFPPVLARQLRFEVDGDAYQGADRHFWITGIKAYSADSEPVN